MGVGSSHEQIHPQDWLKYIKVAQKHQKKTMLRHFQDRIHQWHRVLGLYRRAYQFFRLSYMLEMKEVQSCYQILSNVPQILMSVIRVMIL